MSSEQSLKLEERLKLRHDDILQLAARYGARRVRIFGSVVRGEAGPGSDVDFLVEFEPHVSLLDHVAFKQDLEDLLDCPVDVVSEKALHRALREKVLREAVQL